MATSLWFPAVVAGCLQVQMRLKRGLGVRRHGYLGRLCVADLGQTKESWQPVAGCWKQTMREPEQFGDKARIALFVKLRHPYLAGCQVHPDRRVPRTGGWASEQPGSGGGGNGGRLGLHGRRRPVEPRHHPAGDVLRNQTQRHRPLARVEGMAKLSKF